MSCSDRCVAIVDVVGARRNTGNHRFRRDRRPVSAHRAAVHGWAGLARRRLSRPFHPFSRDREGRDRVRLWIIISIDTAAQPGLHPVGDPGLQARGWRDADDAGPALSFARTPHGGGGRLALRGLVGTPRGTPQRFGRWHRLVDGLVPLLVALRGQWGCRDQPTHHQSQRDGLNQPPMPMPPHRRFSPPR